MGILPITELPVETRYLVLKTHSVLAGLMDLPKAKLDLVGSETICQTLRGCEYECECEWKFNIVWNVNPKLLANARQTRKEIAQGY